MREKVSVKAEAKFCFWKKILGYVVYYLCNVFPLFFKFFRHLFLKITDIPVKYHRHTQTSVLH